MKITIVTAVLNAKRTIEDCMQSALGQNWTELEYILADRGSTDGTLEVVKRYQNRCAKYLDLKGDDYYTAVNKCLAQATGDVVAVLPPDSFYTDRNTVANVLRTMAARRRDCLYGDMVYIATDSQRPLRYYKAGEYDRYNFENGWMPPLPVFFIRRELFRKFGYFATDYRLRADYELIARFLYKNYATAYYMSEVLVKMRFDDRKRSLGWLLERNREDYRVLKEYGLGGFLTVMMRNLAKLPQFFRKPKADDRVLETRW